MGGDSLFFEYACKLKLQQGDDILLCMDWDSSASKSPSLVVGSSDERLSLFHDGGLAVDKQIPLRDKPSHLDKPQPPMCVAWGPAPHHLLAMGWHDGVISLWNKDKDKLLQYKAGHEDRHERDGDRSVMLLKWSPCGSRLVSTDSQGSVTVWELPVKGDKLIFKSKIESQGRNIVTHVVFRTNDQRPRVTSGGEEVPCFYFAGEDGNVFLGSDDKTQTMHVMKMEASDGKLSGTMVLMYDHDCDQIVGINEQLFMYRATGPNEKGESQVVPPIKLAARPVDPDRTMLSLWVAPGLLLTSSNEASLRFWKLKSDENFVLRIEDDKVPPDDKIQAVAFCEQRRLLCAGTERGYVLFWRQCSFSEGAYEAEDWQPLLHATMKLSDGIDELKWAPAASARGLVAARMKASCYILIEHELQRKLREGCLLVQLSNRNLGFASAVRQRDDSGRALPQDELPMERDFWAGLEPRALSEMASTMPIKGCDCNATKIVMWSGTKAEVHQIDPASGQHALESSFETSASNMIISPDRPGEPTYLFLAVEHSEAKDGREGRDAHIGISNLKGYTTQSWPLGEAEGDPIHLDMLGDFLVCSTSRGYLRLWDLSKARNLSQAKPDSKLSRAFEKGEITSVRVNKDGTRVSLLARAGGGGGGGGGKAPALLPDTHLYVYDVENDVFLSHDCGPAFQPVGHAWDPSDARLLACEVRRVYEARLAETDVQVAVNKAEVCFFFATPNQGLQLQHRLGLDVDGQVLLGLHAPHLLLSAKKEVHSSALNVTAQVMRDFVGMECEDLETRRALLEFSYNMTIGNMDEAYKSVKKIKSKELWANMAHMCVKTSRLDVAEQCLSKMGFAAASRAVQEAKEREPERDAHVAMVAVQLGMLADAERLYVGCGRYDLLNKMYQASGQWYKAVDVAEKKDRIHLKVTYLLWARHLEAGGDVQAAIECYEKADAHRTEVPRMLQERGLIKDKLKEYIVKRNDKELWKWFAQYAESHQRLDDALNCYHHAEDFLSMVRVKCYQARNDPSPDVRASAMQAAEDLVDNSDNTAAAFFLATEYEALKQPRDAIRLFEKAGRHKHAVRIACANAPEFDKELLRIALQAPRRTMLDAAAYLEGKGEPALLDAAVTLLHKGGDSSQALQLCFTHRLFDSLRAIADDLGTDTDPQMLKRVGDFFLSNSQFDKAVHLFLSCKDPQQAIDLCERHRVKMTEDMAERLTELLPDKDKDEHGERVRTLVRIAELCMQQQEYHLATKKFTQAGEKARAMDALLKSGDTEKIIYFATVLRSKDIWIRAANYLQTQYGHERQPTYHQKIVEFYTKAKAYKPLAMFYDACAQMEMDDPRRPGESLSQKYQQALLLLKDSRKNLEKAQGDTMMLDRRIETVEKFVSFMSLIGSNVRADQEQGVALCRELLNSHQLEAAVHVGDVFAELIGFHYSVERNYEECYALIQQMQQRRLVVGQHLEPDVLEHIYHAKGIPLHRSQDVDGSIDEDVHEY